jgi:hypothetical protein
MFFPSNNITKPYFPPFLTLILTLTLSSSPSPPPSHPHPHPLILTVTLTLTGELRTWGNGENGRLGHGDDDDEYVPRAVEVLRKRKIQKCICGPRHTFAITSLQHRDGDPPERATTSTGSNDTDIQHSLARLS